MSSSPTLEAAELSHSTLFFIMTLMEHRLWARPCTRRCRCTFLTENHMWGRGAAYDRRGRGSLPCIVQRRLNHYGKGLPKPPAFFSLSISFYLLSSDGHSLVIFSFKASPKSHAGYLFRNGSCQPSSPQGEKNDNMVQLKQKNQKERKVLVSRS